MFSTPNACTINPIIGLIFKQNQPSSFHLHSPQIVTVIMLPFAPPTTRQNANDGTPIPTLSAALNLSAVVDPFASMRELFTFSPFGLCCKQCIKSVTIQLDERCIRLHLKKHGQEFRVATVRSLLEGYKAELDNAKASGTIDPYRCDNNTYMGYSCMCGNSFVKKSNANRHCKRSGCDESKLQKVELIKLCCGTICVPGSSHHSL